MHFQLDGAIEKNLASFTQYFENDISAVIVQSLSVQSLCTHKSQYTGDRLCLLPRSQRYVYSLSGLKQLRLRRYVPRSDKLVVRPPKRQHSTSSYSQYWWWWCTNGNLWSSLLIYEFARGKCVFVFAYHALCGSGKSVKVMHRSRTIHATD